MTDSHLFSVFLIGLLGSVHCVGMCGGIVTALSMSSRPKKVIPVIAMTNMGGAATAMPGAAGSFTMTLSYNAGRIGSYMMAGAIAGGAAGGAASLAASSSLQAGAYWAANLLLVGFGLYLMNAWAGFAHIEKIGAVIWRRLSPLTKNLLPIDSPHKALASGMVWGWLPCGMVYTALVMAMLSGSAASGAATMMAFGLGTLPALLTLGMLGTRLQTWTRKRSVRTASGLLVLSFGLLGLWRAYGGALPHWAELFCVVTGAA